MVVDASALVALVLEEPEAARVRAVLVATRTVLVPAPTLHETMMVLAGRISDAEARVYRVLEASDAQVVPFSEEHARAAHRAFLRYGKGRHRAGLNFGDCMAYAVAKVAGQPLLFVGEDFARTDVAVA